MDAFSIGVQKVVAVMGHYDGNISIVVAQLSSDKVELAEMQVAHNMMNTAITPQYGAMIASFSMNLPPTSSGNKALRCISGLHMGSQNRLVLSLTYSSGEIVIYSLQLVSHEMRLVAHTKLNPAEQISQCTLLTVKGANVVLACGSGAVHLYVDADSKQTIPFQQFPRHILFSYSSKNQFMYVNALIQTHSKESFKIYATDSKGFIYKGKVTHEMLQEQVPPSQGHHSAKLKLITKRMHSIPISCYLAKDKVFFVDHFNFCVDL